MRVIWCCEILLRPSDLLKASRMMGYINLHLKKEWELSRDGDIRLWAEGASMWEDSGVRGVCVCVCVCVLSRSVVSNPLWPHGLQPTRLLCPWDFPGKNTGASCHFLLQGILLIQASNPVSRVSVSCVGRWILYHYATWWVVAGTVRTPAGV